MNKPENTAQPSSVPNSPVDRVPASQLVALALFVKTHAEYLRRDHYRSTGGFHLHGAKMQDSSVGHYTSGEEPNSVWLHRVNIESKIVVISTESFFNLERGEGFYKLSFWQRPDYWKNKLKVF